ncbi:hypothetical protein BH24ACT4_BH24ACT4_18150 [soil metagenome]
MAWLAARSDGSALLLRSEDLDPASRSDHDAGQQADLLSLGLDWDGPVVRQSDRRDLYEAALARLVDDSHTYPLAGSVTGIVDDVVLRRNDGLSAYNLVVVVVVDDADQGVEEVVRGDDLLSSTPRQAHLAALLGLEVPRYLHVPLVLGPDGQRLSNRHGAVTLADLAAAGTGTAAVRDCLPVSLGLAAPDGPAELSAADEPATVDPAPGNGIPGFPAEADCTFAPAGDEVAAAERSARLGIEIGLVGGLQINRVEVADDRQLVDS